MHCLLWLAAWGSLEQARSRRWDGGSDEEGRTRRATRTRSARSGGAAVVRARGRGRVAGAGALLLLLVPASLCWLAGQDSQHQRTANKHQKRKEIVPLAVLCSASQQRVVLATTAACLVLLYYY